MTTFIPHISRPSSNSSMASHPDSPTYSLRSSASSCSSDASDSYRDLQQENHSLRKQLHQTKQQTAIILEQYRQEERSIQKMAKKIEALNASLEEANAKLLDVLEENHELRWSVVDLKKRSTSSTPSPLSVKTSPVQPQQAEPQRRGTFFEDEVADDEAEEAEETAEPFEEYQDTEDLYDDMTPKPQGRLSRIITQIPAPVDPTALSPLSYAPAPAHRRDAISAAQDTPLAESLRVMSEDVTSSTSKSKSSDCMRSNSAKSHEKKTKCSLSSWKSHAAISSTSRTSKSDTVPVHLTSAKRLPKPKATGAIVMSVAG